MSEYTWLERFYTHFLGRDLAYIFAGGLFICVVEYVLYHTVFLPQKLSLELIGFILASYFLGSAIRSFTVMIFPFLIIKLPDHYASTLIFHQDLIKNYESRILDKYERKFYQLAIFTSVGSSSLLSGGFMGIVGFYRLFFQVTPSIDYIRLAFSLVLVGTFMVFRGKYIAIDLGEDNAALANDIFTRGKK